MRKWILLVFTMLLMLLVGCGGAGNVETAVTDPNATIDPAIALQAKLQATIDAQQGDRAEQIANWLAELESAEAKWEANGVQNYTITVNYSSSNTVNQTIYTVQVENGEIVDHRVSCLAFGTNQTCINEEVPIESLTVPGLFELAQNALKTDTINEVGNGFNFEETYGYPQSINLKSMGQFPWLWRVTNFQIDG